MFRFKYYLRNKYLGLLSSKYLDNTRKWVCGISWALR